MGYSDYSWSLLGTLLPPFRSFLFFLSHFFFSKYEKTKGIKQRFEKKEFYYIRGRKEGKEDVLSLLFNP